MADSSVSAKRVHSLVLDAGPIIKNDPAVSSLLALADRLYTVPAVVSEIRDEAARTRVETTLQPFLTLRSPKPASLKVISDFARKTGDLEVLSQPDLQILALAYELECERNHGDWRLRSVPGQKGLNGVPPASLLGADAGESAAVVAPLATGHAATGDATSPEEQAVTAADETPTESLHDGDVLSPADEAEPPADRLERTHLTDEPTDTPVVEETAEDSESDGEGWITPSNIKKHKAQDENRNSRATDDQQRMEVATLTTDYAMQNVLLRMNLHLLSPSLQTIRQLRTWVLRCHGCFWITKDMTKQFCTRCGKPTMMRASCSTDKNGIFRVHLKKNMQYNTRGNVFSIPKPVAGTANGRNLLGGGKNSWGQSLILAEDQKEYVRAVDSARRRKDKDLMDADYLPAILSGQRNASGGRPKIGAGRDVNAKRRR